MSLIRESKIISLNSIDSKPIDDTPSGYLSNVNFHFNHILINEKNVAYATISLHSIDMVNSFYNINELNNKVDVKITIVASGNQSTHTITIPIGNYSATSFITIFNSLLSSTTGKAGVLALDRNNGKYSLSPHDNTYTIQLLTSSTIYDVLGITQNTNPSFTFGGNNVFDKGCNFLGTSSLHIFSKALTSNNIDSKALVQNNLIAVIPIVNKSYSLITYESKHDESILSHKDITDIDIKITDRDGGLVNFNSINWNITFTMTTFRIFDLNKLLNIRDFVDYIKPNDIKKIEPSKKEKDDDTEEDDILLP